ncbi:hypothetical protein CWS01_15865 [Niallia nealsonii]|uniref:SPOR domain-containing protein n=1 Tax=Niallia nealsonii TaxID=115979 RepID=A0A2N0YZB5_9BACI|nr:hypothetical protein CWS01_15865 [Niallia nealsonii]
MRETGLTDRGVKSSGYKDAYIRKTDKTHQIQVGAFSSQKNAEKLVKELKEQGHTDAWITN